MNYLAKTGLALLSVGGIGGATISGYYHFSKDSFSSKLGISLLNLTGDENSKEWNLRLTELNAKSTGLDSKLAKLKNKKWEDLKNWCNNNKDNTFNKENDITYQNFEEFCTWKIGDKLTTKISSNTESTHADWGKAHAILKRKNKNELSLELQSIHEATNAENADKKAIHNWCTTNYKKTWNGDSQIFKEIKEYCKTE